MNNESIKVDNTNWSVDHVSSFTSISDFIAWHSTSDHSDEHLKLVYELVNAEKPKGKNK
jgi:hypothetical protein